MLLLLQALTGWWLFSVASLQSAKWLRFRRRARVSVLCVELRLQWHRMMSTITICLLAPMKLARRRKVKAVYEVQWRRCRDTPPCWRYSGAGTNLKVGGTRKNLFVVPLHFFSALQILVSAFEMIGTDLPVSCLLFFYSQFPQCPAICKSGGTSSPCPMESAPLWTDVTVMTRRPPCWRYT